jgi:3-hydroxybutyryl-CoA dehydrogenase
VPVHRRRDYRIKDARYAAPLLLRRMVTAGLLGRKSGRGFYTYQLHDQRLVTLKAHAS